MIVLRLEKALGYDDPGWHDLKQQAMRIIDSPHLIDCKPIQSRPAHSKLTPHGTTFLSARAFLSGATPIRSRAVSPFFVPGRMLP